MTSCLCSWAECLQCIQSIQHGRATKSKLQSVRELRDAIRHWAYFLLDIWLLQRQVKCYLSRALMGSCYRLSMSPLSKTTLHHEQVPESKMQWLDTPLHRVRDSKTWPRYLESLNLTSLLDSTLAPPDSALATVIHCWHCQHQSHATQAQTQQQTALKHHHHRQHSCQNQAPFVHHH